MKQQPFIRKLLFYTLVFLSPFVVLAQTDRLKFEKGPDTNEDSVSVPSKQIPPPEAFRGNNSTISARFAPCTGTVNIAGCNGTKTINKSCLQSDQYFTYDYYGAGNLACFARTDQNCNITTEGWGMCLDYNLNVPNIGASGCYTTYYRTSDLACTGLTTLQASQILWMMNNALAWGYDVNVRSGRTNLNAFIWQITNPSLFSCGSFCAAAKAAVTTPYSDISCRIVVLCPNNTTIQPMVIFTGLNGGNPPTVGGVVTPSQTICLGQNLPTTPSLSAHLGNVVRWEYATPGGPWVNWGGAGSVTAPSNCCFGTVGVWRIRAVVKNGDCPEQVSSEIQITVVAPPVITTQPANLTICTGGTGSFTVAATGTSLTYQWQWSSDGTTGWTNAGEAGNTTATLSGVTNTSVFFRVLITSTVCTVISNNVQLTIVADPSVSVGLQNTPICVGGNVTLNATRIGGIGSCTFQWQSSPNGTTWTDIGGATLATYTTTPSATTRYRVRLFNCTGIGCCN